MNYFLIKTEPGTYSYTDLIKEKRTVWSGVAAAPALIHLRAMRKGDLAFFYHTGSEKQIVGIATIASDPYPDPTVDDPRLVVVDIKPQETLKNPVTLSLVKNTKELAAMPLVRIGRLSVQPVTEKEWKTIISLSKKP
ncbi:MAG: EVE domain-containing protein [Bacteroidota bacterium]